MSYISLFLTFSLQILKVYSIINGVKVEDSEFPSIVILKFNDSFYCGASIILPKFILTSGVCGFNVDRLEGIGIHFNDLFQSTQGTMLKFEDIVVHPKFKMGNTTAIYDIAIVILHNEIEFSSSLTAIPIYEKPLISGLSCQSAGWGMVNEKLLTDEEVDNPWGTNNVLRKSTQVIVDLERCAQLIDELDTLKLLPDIHICARGGQIKQGPSFGDFGGPLICDGQQAGISTHSLYDRNTKYLYTVYTPIYINEKWISQVISGRSGKKPQALGSGFAGGKGPGSGGRDKNKVDGAAGGGGGNKFSSGGGSGDPELSARVTGSTTSYNVINNYLILFLIFIKVRF